MSKNIFSVFVLSLLFMLSGCGSNSKPDAVNSVQAKPAAVEMQKNYIVQDASGTNFTLAIPMTKKLDSRYKVELNAYDLNVNGCVMSSTPSYSPSHLVLNGDEGTVGTIYITGTFDENCTIAGYTFEANQIVTKDGKKDERKFSAEFDYHNPDDITPPTKAGYSFYNATTPVIVSQSDTPYEIKVQLLKDGNVNPGSIVTIKPFSATYGDIAAYSVTTGADGYAHFAYTSPSKLPVNGASTELEVSFMDEHNATISEKITLKFKRSGSSSKQSYSLVNETNLTVTVANTDYPLSIMLIDKATGVGVVGKMVTIATIGNSYGKVSPASVSTDASGTATFTYTSPSALSKTSTKTTIRFTDDNNNTIVKEVNIEIKPAGGTTGFKIAKVTSPIVIDTNSQQKEIIVTVVDSTNNVPVKNKTVQISSIEQGYGDIITSTTVQTDDSGRAVFRYAAPSDISVLTHDSNITLYLMENNNIVDSQVTHLTFQPKAGVQVNQIYIQPSILNVQTNSKDYRVKITALDKNNYGVVSHFKIQNPVNGNFDKPEFDTDSSGNAELIYTAPRDITAVQDKNITVTDTVSQKSEQFLLKFIQPTAIEKFYELELSTTNTVSVDGHTLLGINIHKVGDKNTLILSSDVKDVNLTIKHINLLRFDNNDTEVNYSGEASKSYSIYAQNLSGVAIVQARATIFNGVKNVTITQNFPIVVMSGPLASMSMFHVSSELNITSGLYSDLYTIHAVDKYGNPVREGTTLHPSLINGVKVKKDGTGKIVPGSLTTFEDNASFIGVNSNDRLIIMPSATKSDNIYLGNWSISSATNNILNLTEIFEGASSVSGLSYIVGNENRVIKNNIGKDQLVTADISSQTGKYETDGNGNMQFVVNYDPLLKGEKFYVAANGDSDGKRIGISLESIFYYGGYKLLLPFSDIYVSAPGQTFSMNFTVLDALGQVANDTTDLVIPHFEVKYGSILIDNTFDKIEYTAPESISQFNGTTYNFNVTVSGADEIYQTVSVHFNTTPPVDTSKMNLIAVPKEVNVTVSKENREIALYLENSTTHTPVSDTVIQAVFFDPTKGTLDNYSTLTDANGKATFLYKAPQTIPDGSFPITFKVAKATQLLDTNVIVNFTNAYRLETVVDDIYIDANADNTPQYNTAQKVGFYVLDYQGKKVFDQFTIKVDTYDTRYGQVVIDNTNILLGTPTGTDLDGNFIFIPPADLTGLIGTTYDFNMTIAEPEGKGVVHTIRVHYGNAGTVDTTGMVLRVTPDDINVNNPDDERTIALYLIDANNNPVKNAVITASLFDEDNGTLLAYSAATDLHGKALFTYKAPLKMLNGSFPITFKVANATSVLEKNVIVHMGTEVTPPTDTTGMALTAIPSDFNVSTAGESRTISLYLAKGTDAVSDVNIKANFFDPNKGTLNSYIVKTNANGQAVFNYTAPDELPNGNVKVTFDVENPSASIAQDVTVNFVDSIDTTVMKLYVLPSELNVSAVNTTYSIDAYLEDDNTDSPIENQVVYVRYFDPAKGTMDRYSSSTDINGHVRFIYTSPNAINIADMNMTFGIQNGVPLREKNVTVRFDDANYMIEADDNLTIGETEKTYPIRVSLWKQDQGSDINTSAVGKMIVADYIMPMYGGLKHYESIVGDDGVAVFEYVSPTRNIDLNDTNITFYFKEDMHKKDTTTLSFVPEMVEEVSKLMIVPGAIKITQDGETRDITLITVNSANVGISSKVTVEEPTLDGEDYGSFSPSGTITTDASGRATITYTAPSISGLVERNITMTEQSKQIQKELNIKYEQATGPGIDYVITVQVPKSLSVDTNDQITVLIHQRGDETNVIDDANVHEVNLTSLFPNMLQFKNATSKVTYQKAGTKPVEVQTQTLSGSAVIEVNASIYNGDSNVTINTSVPITILSGPVTSMSLTYGKTLPDDGTGTYGNTYTIHAVDKYNNPAREGITLHPSIVNGRKVTRSNATNNTGKIAVGTPVTFDDSVENFISAGVDETKDILAILPNVDRIDQAYLGNWSLDSISAHQLDLVENYYGVSTNSLNYVIGNSERYIDGYGKATVDIKSSTGKYVTDENGTVSFIVTFDRILSGHTVTISANGFDNNRTGVSKVAALRWSKYSSTQVKVPNDNNDHNVTLQLGIDDGVEKLIDIEIVPSSIKSDVADCDVNLSVATNNFHTDKNGQITFTVSTGLVTNNKADECIIEWSATQGGIFLEY